jgi:carbamoyl-phosphate synthase small subunit
VQSLGDWMLEREIVGIHDIDTRALVRHLRDHGAQQGVIASGEVDERALVEEAAALPPMEGQDLASVVTCEQAYSWRRGTWSLADGYANPGVEGPLVAVLDFGVKLNILRNLCDLGCRVAVLPSGSDAESVRAFNPDGLFLSNGPGDPNAVEGAVELVRQLLPDYPTFGICLGHQVLALALGAKTYKMKFGHHGGNQPVQEIDTGVIDITAQNHGFAVDADSLPDTARVTHVNLNDGTVEGLAHRRLPVFSVQYHPESSPGPHEASHLFDRFIDSMATGAPVAATEGLLQRDLVAGRG